MQTLSHGTINRSVFQNFFLVISEREPGHVDINDDACNASWIRPPVECAGILEEAGHEVLAILTADEHLAAWARGRELPVHDPREPGLAGRLNEMAPDYL